MNLFELFVKIGVDDQASGKLSNLSNKLGNGLKTAANIGTAAVGAAAAGITALTMAAVNNYAEYEQLVGGVETLFKSSSDTVVQYAQNAYKTAGLSANDYMNTVTSFSASLLQSLGGDTDAAAKKADVAITDMADNANKMGTSIEMLQTTYAGFAKQNFTMLDNLKLGYGGTKEEMQRLLDDASKISGIKYDISSFADITDAIHVMQEEMGIAGATALEAGTTIQGSIGAMKGAWTNLITGLADGNANIGQLVDNLVTTIVGDGTESNLGVIGNILPAVQTALTGASTLVSELIPQIVGIIPNIITENLPILAEAAISIIQSLVDGISQNQEMMMETAMETITYLANSLITMLPQIVGVGIDLILSLVDGIEENLPSLLDAAISVIKELAGMLSEPSTLENLLDSAISILFELTNAIIEAAPIIIDACIAIIENLAKYLLDGENLRTIGKMALDLLMALVEAIIKSVGNIALAAVRITKELVDKIMSTDWKQVGADIINALVEGLESMGNELISYFKDFWNEIKSIFYEEDSGVGTYVKKESKKAIDSAKKTQVDIEKIRKNALARQKEIEEAMSKFYEENAEKTASDVLEIADKTNDSLLELSEEEIKKRKKLREEFLDFVENTTDKMIETEKKYSEALDQRTEKIKNSFDIFEEYQEAEKKSGMDMLKNIYAQNNAIAQFYANIEKLEARGASTSLVEEFLSRGVSSAAELSALLGMSDYQLQRYFQGYADREQIASKYANMQLSEEKQELQNQLATMFDSISGVYDENAEELGISFIDKFVQSIKDGTANIATALRDTVSTAISQAMGTMPLLKTATAGGSFAGSLASAMLGAIKGDNGNSGLGIYLNGDLLVGGISERMNGSLGENYSFDLRGVMS